MGCAQAPESPEQKSNNAQTKKIVRKSYIFIIYHIVHGFCFSLIKFLSTERSFPMTITYIIFYINCFSYLFSIMTLTICKDRENQLSSEGNRKIVRYHVFSLYTELTMVFSGLFVLVIIISYY